MMYSENEDREALPPPFYYERVFFYYDGNLLDAEKSRFNYRAAANGMNS